MGSLGAGSYGITTFDELATIAPPVLLSALRAAVISVSGSVAEQETLLEDRRRSGERQAAPLSKGDPAAEPARPCRRSGKDHGRHGHRGVPVGPVDRELATPMPTYRPDYGGGVVFEREAEQFSCALRDARPIVTRFTVGIGRCRSCKKRLQRRHPE